MLRSMRVVSAAAPQSNHVVHDVALFAADGSPLLVHQSAATLPITPATTATAIGTAAKTTTAAEPAANTMVLLKFTNGNSVAAPTVAFAGGAARAIQLAGATPAAGEITIAAGGVGLFWFDGTVLHQAGALS